MTIRGYRIIGIIALVLSSYLMFQIKHKVQNITRQLRETEASIITTQQQIHILNAEYSYLTKPDTINLLARKFLKLEPISPKMIIYADELSTFSKGGRSAIKD